MRQCLWRHLNRFLFGNSSDIATYIDKYWKVLRSMIVDVEHSLSYLSLVWQPCILWVLLFSFTLTHTHTHLECLKKNKMCCWYRSPVLSVQLHLGVNSGATKFAIERLAVNEATFRCADELGWQPQVRCFICSPRWANLIFCCANILIDYPQRVPIVPEDGGINQIRKVSSMILNLLMYTRWRSRVLFLIFCLLIS